MKQMTIGKISTKTGIGIETIRFYERQNLLKNPSRTTSGYRVYDLDVIQRLQFIKRAKELGFSLKEIRELLSLKINPKSTCGDVKKKADVKIKDVQSKIKDLQKIKRILVKLSNACSGKGPIKDCPIMESLDFKEIQDE